MEYLISGLILWCIFQVHGLHYRNRLQEKLVKDFWSALQALKVHVENTEVTGSNNEAMVDSFLLALERFDERLGTLEPKVEED